MDGFHYRLLRKGVNFDNYGQIVLQMHSLGARVGMINLHWRISNMLMGTFGTLNGCKTIAPLIE